MGGRSIQREPQVLTVSDAAQKILAKAGWLFYLNRVQESNETVAIEFLQNLQENHTVAIEFLQNLQENHSTVRGKHIAVIDDVIADV